MRAMTRRHDKVLAAAIAVWMLVIVVAYLAVAATRTPTTCARPSSCWTGRVV